MLLWQVSVSDLNMRQYQLIVHEKGSLPEDKIYHGEVARLTQFTNQRPWVKYLLSLFSFLFFEPFLVVLGFNSDAKILEVTVLMVKSE